MSAQPQAPVDMQLQADSAWPAQVLELLALRTSLGPKLLAPPAPTVAQWAIAADLALRAPDHGGLRPFRFVVVDDAQRQALSVLFGLGAAQRGQGAEQVERARARAFNGPGLVALVARVRGDVADVPPQEQWMTVGAALMNFLNALHLMGFGAKALSGASVSDPAVHAAFCGDGEVLATWIIAGSPRRSVASKPAVAGPALITAWQRAPTTAPDPTTSPDPG